MLQVMLKSQKIHVQSHDGLPNFTRSTLFDVGLRVTQTVDRVAGISLSLTKY